MWFRDNTGLLATLIIGGIIRAFFLFWFFADLGSDPDAYKQIAVNVRTKGIYGQRFGDSQSFQTSVQSTAFRPPLYPLVLSLMVTNASSDDDQQKQPTVSLYGIAVFHWCLGIATLALAYSIGRNHQLSQPCCFVLAMLVACDPIALRQSCLPMTETIAVFLATLGIWVFAKRRTTHRLYFLGIGILLGVFTLCRPTFLIWAGLIFLIILMGWFSSKRIALSKRLVHGALFLLGVALALTPWTIRNYVIFGKPIFATSHGGYTVFLGNNDSFYDYLKSDRTDTWDGEKELREIVLDIRRQSLKESENGWIVDEVIKDRLYYEKAKEVIFRRPSDFGYACWVRVVRFWSIIPKRPASDESSSSGGTEKIIRYATAVWYGVVFLFAVMGVFRLATLGSKGSELRVAVWKLWLPAILLIIAFQGLHLLYWSNMRMRAPLVVVIALLAVIGGSGPRWAKRLSEKFRRDR